MREALKEGAGWAPGGLGGLCRLSLQRAITPPAPRGSTWEAKAGAAATSSCPERLDAGSHLQQNRLWPKPELSSQHSQRTRSCTMTFPGDKSCSYTGFPLLPRPTEGWTVPAP